MKSLIYIIFIFTTSLFKAQLAFNVEYEADYKLNYKYRNTPNAYVYEEAFALLMNNNESYFKNMNKYVGDSLILEKKLKETGNIDKDISNFSKYSTDFPENIGVTNGKIYVSLPIGDKSFKYEESNNIDWKLINEFKTIGRFKCQKAVTKKYGRNWIAYFTKEIPLPYGPYKFNKLPGLILEVYDEKNDYHYTLYSFKKRKYICKSANLYTNAKLVDKKKVFDYKRNISENSNRFDKIIKDPETLQKIKLKSKELAKAYNPIDVIARTLSDS